jgi:hypothetical protein
MIDCSTLSSRCYVSANEQAICSLLWAFWWIVIPLSFIIFCYIIYRTFKNHFKKKGDFIKALRGEKQ